MSYANIYWSPSNRNQTDSLSRILVKTQLVKEYFRPLNINTITTVCILLIVRLAEGFVRCRTCYRPPHFSSTSFIARLEWVGGTDISIVRLVEGFALCRTRIRRVVGCLSSASLRRRLRRHNKASLCSAAHEGYSMCP